jgi:hypothetical protein
MMPDRIQITHQPGTMSTPTIRAALDTFQQAANRGTAVYLSPELVQELRTALKAEPEGEGPSETDLYDLAEEFNGDPVPAMRRALEVWGNPLPGAPAEALAARPLLERVAQLGDVIGRQTVAQVRQLAEQADAWLRSNPPGQPVAIEPRGCPTPGACSCVEPTPPAPGPGDVGELVGWLNQVAQYLVDNGVTGAPHVQGAAILLERQDAELIALRQQPHPTFQDAIKLAQGCHDYSGGHSGAEGEAWHGAIGTVVDVLKRAAIGPWDSQTRAVYGVGAEAQAGDVGELVEWLTMLRDHSKGVASNYDNKLEGLATLLQRQEAELAALRGVPVAVSERLRIVKAGIRAGYNLGHHHTVEGGWGDPDEVADDIAQETLDDIGLPPAPQCLIARMADELDRLQPLPAFPPITSHPLAIEAHALLRGGTTTSPAPQAGEVEA